MIKDILLALTYHNNPQLVESAKSTLGLIDQEFINTEISSFDGSIDEEPCKTCNIEYDINTGIKENIKLLKKNRNLNITKENGVEGIPNLLTRYQDCEPIKNFLRINSIDAFKSIFKSFGKDSFFLLFRLRDEWGRDFCPCRLYRKKFISSI